MDYQILKAALMIASFYILLTLATVLSMTL
jgi:hypothetical protein